VFYAKYGKPLLFLHYMWRWFRATLRKTTGIPKEPPLLNVRVNAAALKDEGQAANWLAELDELEHCAEALVAEVQTVVEERGGLVLDFEF